MTKENQNTPERRGGLIGCLARLVLCRRGKHFYGKSCGLVRSCKICGAEQYLVGRSYPRIGQAKYYWRDKPFSGCYGKKRLDKFIPPNEKSTNAKGNGGTL